MITPRLLIVSLVLALAPAALRAAAAESTSPNSTAPTAPAGRRGAGGRMNPADRLKHMKDTLGLTDEQTEKIKAIFQKNHDKLSGMKDLKPEERRTKARDFMKSEMADVAAILTPEQKEKWKEEMKKHRSEGGGKRRAGAAPVNA